jgi:hypothetical protein
LAAAAGFVVDILAYFLSDAIAQREFLGFRSATVHAAKKRAAHRAALSPYQIDRRYSPQRCRKPS